ncbi:DUF6371 domain-containing protein [Emticicia agri]|uniref:Toprim domain-containing protein n=1 Tax=Emticicia agri TaxID=2492393 RepID=A0A4Q5M3D2_9BACT|nr:DUF6371 domain-containing protein [Emticicia agri]RYU96821.1 hypothetical protein EWM59_04650 [Emticicia agri]
MQHKFMLQPYKGMKTRYTCPHCRQTKAFTRYINTETQEHLAEYVGRCNREVKCGYHYTPKQYFQDNPVPIKQGIPERPVRQTPPSYIDRELFKGSLQAFETNHLITFLSHVLGQSTAYQLAEKYFIGSSRHWPGATVFWQLDKKLRIRAGKIMLYNPTNGKRVKEPFSHITWVHRVLNLPDFNLQQCFFGEHLLAQPTRQVAIVESEKTALIAHAYEPNFIWLASGSLSNLTHEKCKVLQGRKVYLFPDINATDKWRLKAAELSSITRFIVSDELENIATDEDRQQGLDLADYLLRTERG